MAFLTVAGLSPTERLFGPVSAEEARAALAPDGWLPDMEREQLPQSGDPRPVRGHRPIMALTAAAIREGRPRRSSAASAQAMARSPAFAPSHRSR